MGKMRLFKTVCSQEGESSEDRPSWHSRGPGLGGEEETESKGDRTRPSGAGEAKPLKCFKKKGEIQCAKCCGRVKKDEG